MTEPRETFADLPILDELGDDLERAYRAGERSQEPRARASWWRRRGLVVAIATGVAVLLVPTAIATKSLWAPAADNASPGHPSRPTAPVQLEAPRAPTDSFRLSASQTDVGLCLHVFITGGGLGESCAPHPSAAHPVTAFTGGGAHDGFVVGTVAPTARTVRVAVNGGQQDVTAFAPDPKRLALAHIPADFRLYAAFVPAAVIRAGALRVVVTALDAQGAVMGRYPAG